MKTLILVSGIVLLVIGTIYANFGSSVLNKNTWISFQHTSALDSARAYFGYPDTSNFYSDVKLTVNSPDSFIVGDTTITELDSLGSHVVRIVYFPRAGDSGYSVGQWLVDDRENASDDYAVNLMAYDSSNNVVINAVSITVRNVAQSSIPLANGLTDSDGIFQCNLAADSVVVVAVAPGYNFSAYDTLVIAGAETDTLWGYPANTSANLVTVYGYFKDLNSNGIRWAEVVATLPPEVINTCDSGIMTPGQRDTLTDGNGYFAFNLVRSSCLDDGGGDPAQYTITITPQDGSGVREKKFLAPDSTSYKLYF
jgi:hypothetical protein